MILIEDNKYFILYSCCIPVKGANRSIICDLQKKNFIYIPNDVFNILTSSTLLEVEMLSQAEKKELELLIKYLTDHEMGFVTSNAENFMPIDLSKNDFSEGLKNIIIDFNKDSNHDLLNIAHQISELRCSAIELRFFDKISQIQFTDILSHFDNSTIRSIHICLSSDNWTTYECLNKLYLENKRLKQIIVHNHESESVNKIDIQTLLIFSKQKITDETHCGYISPHYFTVNLDFFKESLFTNNCLDGKIGIDKHGYIKNCPSFSESYGLISEVSLKSVLDSSKYNSISKVKKDEIQICQNCEFRYICHDCRAYLQNQENIFSKPEKCNYDPFTNTWS